MLIDKNNIENSYNSINENLDKKTKLLAVSKYQSIEKIKFLYSLGQKSFGENYLQELEEKAKILPDLDWHFIGKIQSKKIKQIVKYVNTIHSVDKFEQIEKIDFYAQKHNKIINIFLQINIDKDENKSGFLPEQLNDITNYINLHKFNNVNIVGLMCLPKSSINSENSFIRMKEFFEILNKKLNNKIMQLSMGMSADYKIAIKYNSTIVRIGSILFGKRSSYKL